MREYEAFVANELNRIGIPKPYVEPLRFSGDNIKQSYTWWQERGLSYTATGYGSKIPTSWKVLHNNRWKRVYCRIYSNSGTLFIMVKGKQVNINIDS